MLSDPWVTEPDENSFLRLNAPYGARCFLTAAAEQAGAAAEVGLNAPYGARCFLTLITTNKSKQDLEAS